MRQVLDCTRRVFIHDYDGVHYDYAAFDNIYDFLAAAKAEAVTLLLPDLNIEEAKAIGKRSYLLHHDGLHLYAEMAAESGMDARSFKAELQILYHQVALRNTRAQYSSVFDPCKDTNAAFEALGTNVRHALLTQGCLENWTLPLLAQQDRLQYFDQTAFVGFAEMDFMTKSGSTRPLEIVLERANATPQEAVFIEDSLPNLKRAKELSERILNVYVSHDKPLDILPDYVDIQTRKPWHFLNQAATMFTLARPQPVRSLDLK